MHATFKPTQAYTPPHPSLPVHGAPSAPAAAEQPPHTFKAGALQVTAFVPAQT